MLFIKVSIFFIIYLLFIFYSSFFVFNFSSRFEIIVSNVSREDVDDDEGPVFPSYTIGGVNICRLEPHISSQ